MHKPGKEQDMQYLQRNSESWSNKEIIKEAYMKHTDKNVNACGSIPQRAAFLRR
jgi:hypothetical protein